MKCLILCFKFSGKEKEGIGCEDMDMIQIVTQPGHAIQITIPVLLIVIDQEKMNGHLVRVIVVLLAAITAHPEVIQVADVVVQSHPHDHLEEVLFMIDAKLHHHIDLVGGVHQSVVLEGVHIVVIVEVLLEVHMIAGMLIEILLIDAHLQEAHHIDIPLGILSNF